MLRFKLFFVLFLARVTNLIRYHCLNPAYCVVCSTWKNPADMVAGIGTDYACSDCVEPNVLSYGRFDAYRCDPISMAKVMILSELDMNSAADDYMGNTDSLYVARFGCFLLYRDSQGFVTFDELANVEAAEKEYQSLYESGYGADEFDAFIFYDRNGIALSVEGKHIGTYPRMTRARAAMRLYATTHGYYPPLWLQDRGYTSLLTY